MNFTIHKLVSITTEADPAVNGNKIVFVTLYNTDNGIYSFYRLSLCYSSACLVLNTQSWNSVMAFKIVN